MTIASEINKSGPYFGNGVTTAFDYEFKISDEAHIRVILSAGGVDADMALDVDYQVTGVGSNGGTIITSVPPATGTSITLVRAAPFTQGLDLQNQGAFFAEAIETGFDLSVARDQQLLEELSRAVRFPPSADPADMQRITSDIGAILGFSSRYLGAFGSDPSEDSLGTSLLEGALYFNTGSGTFRVYHLGFWQDQATGVPDVSVTPAKIAGWTLQPQGRLSLVAGTPTPESDVSGATSVYYVPSTGSYLPIWDGLVFRAGFIGAGLSLPLDADSSHPGYHGTNSNFDIFAFLDGATVRIGTHHWLAGGGSDIARGVGAYSCELEAHTGVLVNKNLITLKWGAASSARADVPARRATYLGSFRTIAAGQTADTYQRRFVFNAYNQAIRPMVQNNIGAGSTWDYSAQVYRQAKNDPAAQVEMLLGLSGIIATARVTSLVRNNDATPLFAQVAIGLDGTFAPAAQLTGYALLKAYIDNVSASYNGFPGLGHHRLVWLECGAGAGIQTWYGSNFDIANRFMTGISGEFLG